MEKRNTATQVINQVIDDFSGNWNSVKELANQPDSDDKLQLLQDRFNVADFHNLNREQLAELIETNEWQQIHGDDFNSLAIPASLLSAVIQIGIHDAISIAQKTLDMKIVDGYMGDQTIRELNQVDIDDFISRYSEEVELYRNIDVESKVTDKNFNINNLDSETATEFNHPDSFSVDSFAKKSNTDVWTYEDQLGYERYAHAIAKLIIEKKAEPPLTVSIQAPWGQGKTSLMRMIKYKIENGLNAEKENKVKDSVNDPTDTPGVQTKLNDLDDWITNEKLVQNEDNGMLKIQPDTIPCVWFNPLYFQNSKQLWSGLAHVILHQLADKLDSKIEKERFWFRLRLTRINTGAIRRDIHNLILERLLPKGLMWFGILLIVLILPNFLTGELPNLFTENELLTSSSVVFGAVVHGLLSWFKKNKNWTLNDKLAQYINEPNYEGDLGLLHLIEHDLDRALKLLLGKDGHLVVFIDDLDRCSPETVNNILLAINQFISVQNRKLYFILGMDTHMVAMAIETAAEKQAKTYNKNRHSSKGFGWRFMEKFVQLPFFIPRIVPDEARTYLDHLLKPKQEIVSSSHEINELKKKIDGSINISEIQEYISSFKTKHNVNSIPEVEVQITSKIIDMISDEESEDFNNLINAAMEELELNPREIKRFLNVARLLFINLGDQEDTNSHHHMLKVVRASHLILNWPQCLRWFQGNSHSYTLSGIKLDPVESIDNLFENESTHSFESWRAAIKATWGNTVADTVAQADFYAFANRIHHNKPSLTDIFDARIF